MGKSFEHISQGKYMNGHKVCGRMYNIITDEGPAS